MSAYVSTCTSYKFNTVTPGVGAVAMVRHVFLCLITKISNGFLELQINIKFCVILGKKASDTCTLLSKPYGREDGTVKCF